MWSIGVIIFQLISGKLPFDSPNQEELFSKVMSTDYEFKPSSFWNTVSKQCKDLIEQLIEPNISKRLTPSQALKHPWFDEKNGVQLSNLNQNVVQKLTEFKKPKDFLFICQRIIISCFFVPESQSDIRDAFLHINKSDSGQINFEELKTALPDFSEEDIH